MRLEGFHGRAGFGRRPALVVVDMSVGFTAPESPLRCELEDVVEAIARLLDATRAARLPVVFTTVAYDDAAKEQAAVFIDKVPALLALEAGSRFVEIDPRLAPQPDEPVLTKLFASAFFRTPLASLLAAQQVDGLVVTGASTSGCVRATVVDALQHGYRVVVPREAVGDRNPAAHEANLYDIDAKYGDVLPLAGVLAHLEQLAPAGAR
jgi:nicotinamidase-related amidase